MTTIEKIDQEIIRCKDEMYDIGLYMADANINTTTFKTLENKCVQIEAALKKLYSLRNKLINDGQL